MHVLVFQHLPIEHPGIFRDFMATDGIHWDTIELDAGESIPDLNGYDALIVMGGPMDIWEEQQYPWLVAEKKAIRQAVIDLKLPYLGICLGHQLLADALGGKVELMSEPEVGVLEIKLTTEGTSTPLFADLPKKFNSLQWHGAEVTEAPPGSRIIASSPACAIQALQVGDSAYSLQCHVEITATTVSEWGQVAEYAKSLEQTQGPDGLARMEADASENMADFNAAARLMYNNFFDPLKK